MERLSCMPPVQFISKEATLQLGERMAAQAAQHASRQSLAERQVISLPERPWSAHAIKAYNCLGHMQKIVAGLCRLEQSVAATCADQCMCMCCILWQEALDELKAKAAKLQRTLDQAQREINAIQGILGELRHDSRCGHLVLQTPTCTLHDDCTGR